MSSPSQRSSYVCYMRPVSCAKDTLQSTLEQNGSGRLLKLAIIPAKAVAAVAFATKGGMRNIVEAAKAGTLRPPFGFVVDGSSLQELNGVYGPRLPRRRPSDGQVVDAPPAFAEYVHVGAYAHDSSGWWLVNLRRPARHAGREEDRESNSDDAVQKQGSDETRDSSPLTEVEWVFVDPNGVERFRHPGEGLIPGYGPAWSHVIPQVSDTWPDEGDMPTFADTNSVDSEEPLDEEAAANEALQEVAPQNIDDSELPLLIAPIPADQNGGITSHFYEQLLPQLRRQRAAEAWATALQRHGALPWNNTEEVVLRQAKDKGVFGFVTKSPEESCPRWLFPEEGRVSYADLAQQMYAKESFREAAGCFDAAATSLIMSAAEKFSEDDVEHAPHEINRSVPDTVILEVAPLRFLQASALRRTGNTSAAMSLVESTAVALQVHCFRNVPGAWKQKKLLSVRAYLAIGEILLDAGRPDEAVTGLEQAYALLKRPKEYDELLCIETDEVMSTQEDEVDLDFGDEEDDDEDDDEEDWDPDESVEGKRLQRLLLMSVAASRRLNPPPHLVSPPAAAREGCTLVPFGTHFSIWPMPVKDMQVDGLADKTCPTEVNRTNWIGDEGYNFNSMRMRFKVLQSGNHLRVSRLPEEGVEITHGWGVPLQFFCCNNKTMGSSHDNPQLLVPSGTIENADVNNDADEDVVVPLDEYLPANSLQDNKDHYHVLGLVRDFSEEELKKSFRMLSRVLHPDRPGGSAESFARISTAHECLSDRQCREDFDVGRDLGRAGCDSAEYSLEEEVEYRYWPERRPFQPYGDPASFCRGPDCS
eukprot:g4132.t1